MPTLVTRSRALLAAAAMAALVLTAPAGGAAAAAPAAASMAATTAAAATMAATTAAAAAATTAGTVATGSAVATAGPPPTALMVDRLAPLGAGPLTVGSAVRRGSMTLGDFRVEVWPASREVVVTDTTVGAVVWANVPGTAFVQGSRAGLAMTEYRGYFWPQVLRSVSLTRQTLTAVRSVAGAVTLSGLLSGRQGSRTVATTWAMTLRGVRRGGAPTLQVDVTTGRIAGAALSSVQVVQRRTAGERVSGFGAQYRPYDLSGTLFPLLVREQGVGRGQQPLSSIVNLGQPGAAGTLAMTYAAWPSWLTSAGRAGHVVGSAATAFGTVDLRSRDALRLELRAPTVRLELTAGTTPAEALTRREAATTVPGLPDWTSTGAVLGVQGGTAAVRAKLKTVLDAGATISAVWIQDWSGQRTTSFGDRLWWTWQLDRQRYPGWEAFVDELAAQGIRVLTYVNPMLTDAAAKKPAPPRNLFREAAAKGYLVKNRRGLPYLQDQGEFTAALVDLTNPKARSWYADVIATQVLAGKVSGFMADFGEGLPYDAVLKAGGGARWHNAYPVLWAQTVRDGCRRARKPDCVTFFRSGSTGSAAVAPLFWAGDQMVNVAPQDGMASALLGMEAAGASGWPLMHSDVGGYTSIPIAGAVRAPDLLARWAQLEAFGVFLRTHEGNQPAQNLQVYSDPAQADAFARATRIYAALATYRRDVVAESVATRLPALRHPSLVFPGSAAATADREFFLGSHLLVAPVLTAGATRVSVTFPPGTWRHVLTGQEYAGDRTATVPAPLDTPAAFVRTDDPVGDQIVASLAAAGLTTTPVPVPGG